MTQVITTEKQTYLAATKFWFKSEEGLIVILYSTFESSLGKRKTVLINGEPHLNRRYWQSKRNGQKEIISLPAMITFGQ